MNMNITILEKGYRRDDAERRPTQGHTVKAPERCANRLNFHHLIQGWANNLLAGRTLTLSRRENSVANVHNDNFIYLFFLHNTSWRGSLVQMCTVAIYFISSFCIIFRCTIFLCTIFPPPAFQAVLSFFCFYC